MRCAVFWAVCWAAAAEAPAPAAASIVMLPSRHKRAALLARSSPDDEDDFDLDPTMSDASRTDEDDD
eukprot:CAMPEP_0204328418 /NCGR_PEP_ID=MMETSP0469-20131031/13349_1 /ASSEMBLY_ACC=CAM_ASM_000384 /TAXON_ID=2969 /ORGANISM="Oxyrrhis marina" /LENGTH=66 /DNA_ID=CAMNT_0051310809 /DNA_START=58 /DNA_END=255 /DNA_ORIENTATION=+